MEHHELITAINQQAGLSLPSYIDFSELRVHLLQAITTMLENDFQQMIYMLYRVDVNERKLKYLLQENVGADAAVIITDLIIERQLGKIASRKQYRPSPGLNDNEERW